MEVTVVTKMDTSKLYIGDKILLRGRYTATCMRIDEYGAAMLLDQCLPDPLLMYRVEDTGGYKGSYLDKWLQDNIDEVLPADMLPHLQMMQDGFRVRVPTVDEVYSGTWPLMGSKEYRSCQGRRYWLLSEGSTQHYVDGYGWMQIGDPWCAACVRPVFVLPVR